MSKSHFSKLQNPFSGIKTWLVVLYVCTFSLVTVVGAGIGIGLSQAVQSDETLQSPLVTILQGLATGTLLYVAFFEVLEEERQSGTNGIFQVYLILTIKYTFVELGGGVDDALV